jgi:hypothetical protein
MDSPLSWSAKPKIEMIYRSSLFFRSTFFSHSFLFSLRFLMSSSCEMSIRGTGFGKNGMIFFFSFILFILIKRIVESLSKNLLNIRKTLLVFTPRGFYSEKSLIYWVNCIKRSIFCSALEVR